MYSHAYVTSVQKEHIWTIEIFPTTILLPVWDVGYEGCMAVKAYDSRFTMLSVWLADPYTTQGVDLGRDGCFLYWCDTVLLKKDLSQKFMKHCR